MGSLSAYRLKEKAQFVAGYSDDFVILKSKTSLPVTQYYIVPSDWSLLARTQPLAHVNVTTAGEVRVKTFQPELFNLSLSLESFETQLNTLIH
jgi:hypothetical protein